MAHSRGASCQVTDRRLYRWHASVLVGWVDSGPCASPSVVSVGLDIGVDCRGIGRGTNYVYWIHSALPEKVGTVFYFERSTGRHTGLTTIVRVSDTLP